MESRCASPVDLSALFSDLVRLETELWDLVDGRLRRDHELPLSWYEPMQIIDRVPHCRVADIAEALSITVGGTSKLVDRIAQAGWSSRAPNPEDARSSVLSLTPAGRRVFDAARRTVRDELDAQVAAAVPPRQLAAFASTVQGLRQHFAEQQGRAR